MQTGPQVYLFFLEAISSSSSISGLDHCTCLSYFVLSFVHLVNRTRPPQNESKSQWCLTSTETTRLIRDGEKGVGVWRLGWVGKREGIYLSLHCHHQKVTGPGRRKLGQGKRFWHWLSIHGDILTYSMLLCLSQTHVNWRSLCSKRNTQARDLSTIRAP